MDVRLDGATDPRRSRRHRLLILTLAALVGLTSACTPDSDPPAERDRTGALPQDVAAPTIGGRLTVPRENSKDVPITTELLFEPVNAAELTLQLKGAKGTAVTGMLKAENTWVPTRSLEYGTTYTATFQGTTADGKKGTTTSTFTTMAKPAKQVRVSTEFEDKSAVGVGTLMIVTFGRTIPDSYRDDVERRMAVTSIPYQEGAWRWVSGTEVRYRPKIYWQAGTKLNYNLRTRGLRMGDDWYGRSDLVVDLKVGAARILTVNNRNKLMTVMENGKKVRRIPISLGKGSTPSSSGSMLVMAKLRHTVFDTFAELGPVEGYRVAVQYAQRLTWGGEYIHSAPWSVWAQGRTNVSHGCINISPSNARWLFQRTKVGDPVVVKGTGRALRAENGWTDWNMSWAEFKKGSALATTKG